MLIAGMAGSYRRGCGDAPWQYSDIRGGPLLVERARQMVPAGINTRSTVIGKVYVQLVQAFASAYTFVGWALVPATLRVMILFLMYNNQL